jgi:CubicO group peptidase (beta-lactamase class C family)
MTSIAGLATGSADDLGFCAERAQALVDVFSRDVANARLPGAVLLIARHGQILLCAPIGLQDAARGTPMAADSLFRIYSMTKPVVSVAAMQLVERGELLLSDPVSKYLPEFSAVQVAGHLNGHSVLHRPKNPPTVHDLLRHTAGLTYEILGNEPIQRRYAQARLSSTERSNAEFARELAEIPLMFEPGTVWEYSRATDLLGALLEVASGKSLGDLLAERIFQPLQMHDTGFWVPPAQQHRIAEPFEKDPDGAPLMNLIDVRHAPRLEAGGSGLVSSVGDYARFLQFLLNLGELGGRRILSPTTVRFMTADHLGRINGHRIGRSGELLPPGHGFGLGFAVRTNEGLAPLPGSVGMYYWGGIAGTSFFVDPAKDFFALLMLQAPNQRDHYRPLFRNMVYAALLD